MSKSINTSIGYQSSSHDIYRQFKQIIFHYSKYDTYVKIVVTIIEKGKRHTDLYCRGCHVIAPC
jgi:hypothetical protein